MKNKIALLLVLLAVVVLVSPAIVGRLAEKTMDENLEWAARETGELQVTAEHFERGWFSSEGQHRVTLSQGELLETVQLLVGPTEADELPALVISTHIDHGLIPVTSMARDKGSLSPGLGSAVSTLALETAGGERVDIPGTVYSTIALSGKLHTNYVLPAGARDHDGARATWGDVDISVSTDPASSAIEFQGDIGPLALSQAGGSLDIGGISFEGDQQPTPYGIATGDVSIKIKSLLIREAGVEQGGLETLAVRASNRIEGGRLNGDTELQLTTRELPMLGAMQVSAVARLSGADAEAAGRLQGTLERLGPVQDPQQVYGAIENDLKGLFAAGFGLDFERLDFAVEQGTVATRLRLNFDARDPAGFEWTSLLLSTEASLSVSIPDAIVNLAMQSAPQVGAVIAMGYLVKNGDAWESQAELKKGLLTINGAPIPLPLGQ